MKVFEGETEFLIVIWWACC